MRLFKTLIAFLLFIGCHEVRIDELAFESEAIQETNYLSYTSLDDFISELKKAQTKSTNATSENFYSYRDKMNDLREYSKSGSFTSHEDAVAFLEKHSLYYSLEYDENGELNANEVLKSSKLTDYLNSEGEVEIDGTMYKLSPNDLMLKVESNKQINSRTISNDLILNDCLVWSRDLDCEPVDIIGGTGSGGGFDQCGQYKDYPDYLGCSKGRGFTTYTVGDKRIKYKSFHSSSSCRVKFIVYAESQNRFLRIWWHEARPLRGYAAEKVKYLNWDGSPGETFAETGILSRNTAYFSIPVFVVPRSQCTTSNGTQRCYDASDRHYEVDAYWFWIDDPTGAGDRTEKCDERELCTVENGGCFNSSGQRVIYVDTNDCNNCPGLCINGTCTDVYGSN